MEEAAPSTVSKGDANKLRRYVQSNGHLLKGHPLREEVDQTDLPKATGVYQPFTVLLEKSLVEDLLSKPLPDRLQVRKDAPHNEARWLVELPPNELEAFLKIKNGATPIGTGSKGIPSATPCLIHLKLWAWSYLRQSRCLNMSLKTCLGMSLKAARRPAHPSRASVLI